MGLNIYITLLFIFTPWFVVLDGSKRFCLCVFAVQLFTVIISFIFKINLGWSVDQNMKDVNRFFFYAIDPWPGSSDMIRYSTSRYCKYTLVNTSMQKYWWQMPVEMQSFTILLQSQLISYSSDTCLCWMLSISWQNRW